MTIAATTRLGIRRRTAPAVSKPGYSVSSSLLSEELLDLVDDPVHKTVPLVDMGAIELGELAE